MERDHIVSEIKRTAEMSGGTPLGQGRFFQETRIKVSDWKGKFWVRWGDALREAGLEPNRFGSDAHDRTFLIEKLIGLARELGHLPSVWELRLKARQEPGFPSQIAFSRWLGSKRQVAVRIREYCNGRDGYDDILALCTPIPNASSGLAQSAVRAEPSGEDFGSVYLVKSGRHYKIGSTNAVGRREYELAIQLPEKLTLIHEIRTDDPSGIEVYWHKRFSSKRKGGEWFELSTDDVRAFSRRKFM